jgi:hypothetical protein
MKHSLHAAFRAFGVRVPKSHLLALVAARHPEWTNGKLAKVVGYSRSSLSRAKLALLLDRARATRGMGSIRKGYRQNVGDQTSLEAIDDND